VNVDDALCRRSLRVRAHLCVGPSFAPTYFLATPLGNRKNKSAGMAGIPKHGEIDVDNIKRPTIEQLSAEHQKALYDIKKKIREEKEIQRLDEEVIKQYISHFSI
jgi:hypothetical protein